MQIIEQTGFGVRSAVLTLESPAHQARFVVFPMLHLAMPSFYQAVRRRLQDCDQIVVEGVGGHRTRLVTLAYRIAGRLGRGGLVDQGKGLDLSAFTDRLVRPDVTAAEFASGWRRVTRWLRWTVLLLAPAFGVWMAVAGPRRALGSNVAVDQLPTREEEEMAEVTEALDQLIVDQRDRALCAALVRLATDASEPGSGRWREVQGDPGVPGQPVPDVWVGVGAVAVAHDVQRDARVGRRDLAQGLSEFLVPVAGVAGVGDLAGGDLQGGEQLVVPCRM